MFLLNYLAKTFFSNRLHSIDFFCAKPHQVQEQTFHYLLQSAKDTEFGRKYNFANSRNPLQFSQNVPLSTYEDLHSYIERMMQGEQNILWASPITKFAKSSGTTNARSKFIPVSSESLQNCNFRGGKDMIALYLQNYPNSKVLTGKSLSIGGSLQTNHLNAQTYYGDISAVMMKNLPFWAEYLRSPSLKTALMDKWEAKIEAIIQETLQQRITSMAGVPTWTLVLLQRIIEQTGKKNITEVWENLEVFFHGAVAFTPYRQLFKQIIPSTSMNYMEIYNASEGFFALQDQRNSEEMLLMLDYGVYYEFIPIENIEDENPKTITLDEVVVGKNYAMIISTNAGLWRYKIGDTIKFTNTNPYRIKISGRTKHFINAFGEELMVENAEVALTKACEMTQASLRNFTAAPIYLSSTQNGTYQQGGHEWIVEFEQNPTDIGLFTKILDETLRQVNSDYDAKRHLDIALVAPKVHIAPQGTFYAWLKMKNKLGGQHKVPRLANNREYIDEILQLL
jgi:hypothetical protein